MRVFSSLMAMLFAATSLAQGTLIFNNRTQSGDAPISFGDGRMGLGALPGAMAQLYLVGPGGALTPLTPATTFRTSSAAAMFFVTEINPFVIDGILPGQSATVRLRAWTGPSYEAAVVGNGVRGESNDVTIPQLGGTPAGGAPIPTPSLNGLQGFTIFPEPSTIALGVLGAVALLGFRRR